MSVNDDYSDEEKTLLLDLARNSIAIGLSSGSSLEVDPKEYSSKLQEERATFVTIEKSGELRGCIGMLEAFRPLVVDIAENAFAAAFRDPRFSPLSESEFENLDIHISVLTPPEPMSVSSESDLLEQLRPGIDGLILEDGMNKSTFLPAVWEQLDSKEDFLRHLKLKAGLSANHWSESMVFHRYQALSIP